MKGEAVEATPARVGRPDPLAAPEPRAAVAPPDFVREVVNEVRLFLITARDFTLHPIRFCREWAERRREAMNPIGFFGAAVGLQLGAAALRRQFLGEQPERDVLREISPTLAFLNELLQQQIPLLTAAFFAVVLHWRLRARGSRQLFRATLGAVLFAEGWAALARLLMGTALLGYEAPDALSTGISLIGTGMLVSAVVGVHRLQRWRAAIRPVLVSIFLTGVAAAVALSPLAIVNWKQAEQMKRKPPPARRGQP